MALLASGNTVVVVEHDMEMVAGGDWIIDIGPGAGDEGGKVMASGPPKHIIYVRESKTATYLAKAFMTARRGNLQAAAKCQGGRAGLLDFERQKLIRARMTPRNPGASRHPPERLSAKPACNGFPEHTMRHKGCS
jgi:hypothetical protein